MFVVANGFRLSASERGELSDAFDDDDFASVGVVETGEFIGYGAAVNLAVEFVLESLLDECSEDDLGGGDA